MYPNTRAYDVKLNQSIPDEFDIIKVTTFSTPGDIIAAGSIIQVKEKDSESELPFDDEAIGVLTEDVTLVGDDEVILLGYQRNYSAILLSNQPTFANDLTSVIVAGEGRNMSALNSVTANLTILGFFNKIQLPATSTDMVLIAYR